jgi:hypothetical protein
MSDRRVTGIGSYTGNLAFMRLLWGAYQVGKRATHSDAVWEAALNISRSLMCLKGWPYF